MKSKWLVSTVLAMAWVFPCAAQTAQPQSADSIDDIVITDEKIDRSLRDAASSVTVVTDHAAERLGV